MTEITLSMTGKPEGGARRMRDLKRVTVDATVQPKAITFPTDAKLVHAAIKGLNRLARRAPATVLSARRQMALLTLPAKPLATESHPDVSA